MVTKKTPSCYVASMLLGSRTSQSSCKILKREDKQPEVVIHVSTNDMGDRMDEVSQLEFRMLGSRLRIGTSKVAITGSFPMPLG